MTTLADPQPQPLPEFSLPPEAPRARVGSTIVKPIEVICAALNALIVTLLFSGVVARYVFSYPVSWIDEVASISFLWVAMLGCVLAVDRSEHLRLNVFVEMLPARSQSFVKTFALLVMASFLLFLLHPSAEYVKSEWMIRTPDLNLPNGFRVSAIGVGMAPRLG
jgi:TRAP-type C4-dicarboxylate transport system permease small subunit